MKIHVAVCILVLLQLSNAETEEVEDSCFDSYNKCKDVTALCMDDEVNDIMYRICRKTCRMCKMPEPERKEPYREDCFDQNDKCKDVASSCNSEGLYDIMHIQCRHTCKFCEQPTEGTVGCMDGNLDCSNLISSCDTTDLDLKSALYRKCTKTCGFCEKPKPEVEDPKVEENCFDTNENCVHENILELCNSESLQDIMHTECRKSCGLCKAAEEPKVEEECVDTNHRCEDVLEQCKSENTDIQGLLRQECPKSCGFCKPKSEPIPEVEPITETPKPIKPNKKQPNKKQPKKPIKRKPSHKKPKSQPAKGSCADTITYCERIKHLCSSKESRIKSDMFKKCKKTCELCGEQQIKQHLEIPPAGK